MNTPLRLLIGGSPCTFWSIAQSKEKREITASGQGWELFKNYLIAKEKFKPDYFLYENNKSASQAIKNQIANELGVELQYINSALVSAQNRQRFYAHNIPNVQEPEDRKISLIDILEKSTQEKTYELKHIKNVNSNSYECRSIRIGDIGSEAQAQRVYSSKGKSVNLCSGSGGQGARTGLYLTPIYPLGVNKEDKAHCLDANYYKGSSPSLTLSKHRRTLVAEPIDSNLIESKEHIYKVYDGYIYDKDEKYEINLPDGYYEIRKLTPIECERLQTLPDNYTKAEKVSNTQRYKCLGNGWTAEVIIHILSYIDYPKDAPIEVLSMYDGIATGRYCLEKLGYTNVTYKAYEIDKYAIKIATKNYPDIIECGDAFQIREDNWKY